MAGVPITIKHVAAQAGVSVGTVSNFLNRPDVVADGTRARIQTAISQLGFVRNESARQLRAGRSRTIGLVVLDVTNPFFTDVARGVEDAANAVGLSVILCNSDEKRDKESAYLDLLEEQRVQGLLITPVDVISERLAHLRSRGMPVVLLDRHSADPDVCSVSVDDVLGGQIALDHLLETGHRRIAFVGGPLELAQIRDRLAGAQRSIDASGVADDVLTVLPTTAPNVAGGRDAGARLAGIQHRQRPTAVFCANDLLALGVLQELTRHGIRVPDDMAVVGYDDIEFAAAAAVPLSSVRQPRHLLGRTAAELLLDEASTHGDHEHRQVRFEPEIVVRDSSRSQLNHPPVGRRQASGPLTRRHSSG